MPTARRQSAARFRCVTSESRAAFEAAKPTIREQHQLILNQLAIQSMTAKELERAFNLNHQRASELKVLGLIEHSGQRRNRSAVLRLVTVSQ